MSAVVGMACTGGIVASQVVGALALRGAAVGDAASDGFGAHLAFRAALFAGVGARLFVSAVVGMACTGVVVACEVLWALTLGSAAVGDAASDGFGAHKTLAARLGAAPFAGSVALTGGRITRGAVGALGVLLTGRHATTDGLHADQVAVAVVVAFTCVLAAGLTAGSVGSVANLVAGTVIILDAWGAGLEDTAVLIGAATHSKDLHHSTLEIGGVEATPREIEAE